MTTAYRVPAPTDSAAYEALVTADFHYATSSQRWVDHIAVYPDIDATSRRRCGSFRAAAEREERTFERIAVRCAHQDGITPAAFAARVRRR